LELGLALEFRCHGSRLFSAMQCNSIQCKTSDCVCVRERELGATIFKYIYI
jgi:hypothetical protein